MGSAGGELLNFSRELQGLRPLERLGRARFSTDFPQQAVAGTGRRPRAAAGHTG
jgi:hypothetical protein